MAEQRFPSFVAELPITQRALTFAAERHRGQRREVDTGELERLFGSEVTELVQAVSEPPGGGAYAERKARLRDAVECANADAVAVFAADKVVKAREVRIGL